jgi:hypothetical protein
MGKVIIDSDTYNSLIEYRRKLNEFQQCFEGSFDKDQRKYTCQVNLIKLDSFLKYEYGMGSFHNFKKYDHVEWLESEKFNK